MPDQKTITASLEGMRVIVDGKRCELQEYNFTDNRWVPNGEALWPLSRPVADHWLTGWNDVDRFATVTALTQAPDEPGEVRRSGQRFAIRATSLA